jgi:hypothetical protein
MSMLLHLRVFNKKIVAISDQVLNFFCKYMLCFCYLFCKYLLYFLSFL